MFKPILQRDSVYSDTVPDKLGRTFQFSPVLKRLPCHFVRSPPNRLHFLIFGDDIVVRAENRTPSAARRDIAARSSA